MVYLADFPIEWVPGRERFMAGFEGAPRGGEPPVMTFSSRELLQCHGVQFPEQTGAHLLCGPGGAMLTAGADWTEAVVYGGVQSDPRNMLPLAALCARLAALDTLLLHGAFVIWQGQGLVFTGPSGVGKTTQAQLWNRYAGADIVNGDKVLLRLPEEAPVTAFGLPWTGSSSYGLNRKAALHAVVLLRQGQENRLRQLDAAESLPRLLPQVLLPHWDEKAVEAALDTLARTIGQVPVWSLQCRPDADAVAMLREGLFG